MTDVILCRIEPTEVDPPHCSQIAYLYRGCVIRACESGGWEVTDQTGEMEFGWGTCMYEAQAVANEIADGETRSKSR